MALPRGWFLPVTPSTKFVTLGGAVANDVHGKNHHVTSTFGRHVRRLSLLRTNEGIIECLPEANAELFEATVGGLGLTGIVLFECFDAKDMAGLPAQRLLGRCRYLHCST